MNHVRLCAIRPSFFPLSSVSSRVFGDVAGPAAGQQRGSWTRCGGFFFSLFLFCCKRWLLLLLQLQLQFLSLLELQHMPGVVSSAVFLPGADEDDGFDVHWREVWGASLAAWEECDWEGRSRRPRDGVDRFGGDRIWGMCGCWRACGAGHMCNAYVCVCVLSVSVCVRARLCAWRRLCVCVCVHVREECMYVCMYVRKV